ncbi:putative nitrogen fixation protein NifT [Calothrix sp. NIES-3974]|uniref:putative nitrogen fixation protein NifT n=1 Tax=Calothrix sp. NIES-3974 TaxID=2005462 RepID=UPI000B6153B6|nr:putative nitrogen fixation protein NifT [Calothrix sp. NIES-3974]BAZ07873.1 nitrogen fixation protein FixT [Calothrix sp. NIES-3974]
MKVMLRENSLGKLTVYVPKKDLEEEVIKQTESDGGKVFTLANGWELEFSNLSDPLKLPQTVEARRIS